MTREAMHKIVSEYLSEKRTIKGEGIIINYFGDESESIEEHHSNRIKIGSSSNNFLSDDYHSFKTEFGLHEFQESRNQKEVEDLLIKRTKSHLFDTYKEYGLDHLVKDIAITAHGEMFYHFGREVIRIIIMFPLPKINEDDFLIVSIRERIKLEDDPAFYYDISSGDGGRVSAVAMYKGKRVVVNKLKEEE